MDVEKLSPAPWKVSLDTFGVLRIWNPTNDDVASCCGDGSLSADEEENHAEFIALARNAFDVMMRRKWWPFFLDGDRGWAVESDRDGTLHRLRRCGGDDKTITAGDPFTALVEADKWYAEHVEGKS